MIYIKTGESRKHLPKPLILTYSKHITVKAEKRYSPPVNVSFKLNAKAGRVLTLHHNREQTLQNITGFYC